MTDANDTNDNKPTAADRQEFERQCTAKTSASGYTERCRRAAIRGGTVCMTHGGSAGQVQRAAKRRLSELVEPAIAALERALQAGDMKAAVRGAQIVLDRCGHGPTSKIELETRAGEQLRLEGEGIATAVYLTLELLGIDADDATVRDAVVEALNDVSSALERGQRPAALPPARRQLEAVVDATEAASDVVDAEEVITL